MDENGMHLYDNRLTFLRLSIGSRLYATRMDPTDPNPTAALTAVPAMRGVSGPSVGKTENTSAPGVSLAPPLPPPPLFDTVRAGTSASDPTLCPTIV